MSTFLAVIFWLFVLHLAWTILITMWEHYFPKPKSPPAPEILADAAELKAFHQKMKEAGSVEAQILLMRQDREEQRAKRRAARGW